MPGGSSTRGPDPRQASRADRRPLATAARTHRRAARGRGVGRSVSATPSSGHHRGRHSPGACVASPSTPFRGTRGPQVPYDPAVGTVRRGRGPLDTPRAADGAARIGATATGRVLPPSLVFGSAIGLSAFLLFTVQPLVGRLLLPSYGGAPACGRRCSHSSRSSCWAGTPMRTSSRPAFTQPWCRSPPGGADRRARVHAADAGVGPLVVRPRRPHDPGPCRSSSCSSAPPHSCSRRQRPSFRRGTPAFVMRPTRVVIPVSRTGCTR